MPRPRLVKFFLAEEELAELDDAARRAGLARGAFAAEAALAAARGRPLRAGSPVREALVELMTAAGLVRRVGANLNGCGSFEVSWLRCEDEAVAVAGVVDAFVFPAQVVAPVGVEVPGSSESAELENGLGPFEPPSRACYVHSVLDEIPGMPLR